VGCASSNQENDNELSAARGHVETVEAIQTTPFSQVSWSAVHVTRRVEPAPQPFAFDGQVVVLADAWIQWVLAGLFKWS